jgi:hypothetical protein
MKPTRPKSERLQAEIEKGLALDGFLNNPYVVTFLDNLERKHSAKLLKPDATDAELRAAQTSVLAIQMLRAEMRMEAAAGARAQITLSESRSTHD